MEEKKIDIQSIIGFILIGGILLWMLYTNTPEEGAVEDTQTTEQVDNGASENKTITSTPAAQPAANDSTSLAEAQRRLGAFGYSETLASAKEIGRAHV